MAAVLLQVPCRLTVSRCRRSIALEIPANSTLLLLPPFGPELNPTEAFFQFPKSRTLANQFSVASIAEAVKARACGVWEAFSRSPGRKASNGGRDRANLKRNALNE